eukprot:1183571-Prorocentrum_minimum.AAC.3
MACYGVADFPDGSLWLCRVCELGLDAPPPCAVCPAAGGALMRTTCRRWAHNTCAMWVPELNFTDPDTLEPIRGADAISKARARLKCEVCQQVSGRGGPEYVRRGSEGGVQRGSEGPRRGPRNKNKIGLLQQ